MCGITAIINVSKGPIGQEEIEEINRLVTHRGPDGEGYYLGGNFALGHRRLSIIDLSAEANQPMSSGSNQLIFNGEIYNYIEIRCELLALGYNFTTCSDTEVILKAYEEWGEECVVRFNGMWAFVLYDEKKEILFCSRDRFGIKPFYLLSTNERFIIGSEIKQLLPYLVERKANIDLVLDFLILGLEEHTSATFFQGIEKLPPSTNLIYNLKSNAVNSYLYHTYIPISNDLNEVQATSLVKDLFETSVRIRMRSDVKVGTCLSGGLDSSIVAALSSQINSRNSAISFYAIHAKSSESDSDESSYAKLVSEETNIDLTIIEPKVEDFFNAIEKVVKIQEEPFGGPSVLFQYFVFKQAQSDNCPVILDGQGGDELFLGYERYYFAIMNNMGFLEKVSFLREISKKSRHGFLKNVLYYLYFNFLSLRKTFIFRRLSFVKKEHLEKYDFSKSMKKLLFSDGIKELQLSELYAYQLPHLLKYEDKNSMSCSIESRLPFLDFDLVKGVLDSDPNLMIKDGWSKYLLRKCFDGLLPDSIIWRKNKRGFEAPESTWLKDKDFFEKEIKESKFIKNLIDVEKINKSIDNRTFWRIYSLAIWSRLLKVNF
ncbi:MAG: asparagine synthase (glutamine-hydrolyzing) [Saprospiraceae bacterium]|nr:asparagine synthase (glutamine-hydrolyzing) [Saprospiraceae bacterium]